MHVVHLTASSFFGGPERQILGLGAALPSPFRSSILTFSEGGRCRTFLDEIAAAGLDGVELRADFPRIRAAVREVTRFLIDLRADVLVTHGYKSNLLGRPAARRAGVPIVSVSRGWTGENLKVRAYEWVDRAHLRFMDRVVCVSEGQAEKVRRTGVRPENMRVIHNGSRLDSFTTRDPADRGELRAIAGGDGPIVLAAGRLSPEKGFRVLVEAAASMVAEHPAVRFVVFGEGPERSALEARAQAVGLADHFRLVGFRKDLDALIPWADVVAIPSFTEGLPNVALEAGAAAVPVVATAVGGIPEVIADCETGLLVPPGKPEALAERLLRVVRSRSLAHRLGVAARRRMEERFSFAAQATAYVELFEELRATGRRAGRRTPPGSE
ncbi:MAG TPA: glycosyltransferase, partial [Gemmataceae bacterium]|nr:glycosyltransferase [Gemmataceae bacterium]